MGNPTCDEITYRGLHAINIPTLTIEGTVLFGEVKTSTPNMMRFVDPCRIDSSQLITDIDMLFFDVNDSVVEYHERKAQEFAGGCYYAHHGPRKWPVRFKGQKWVGDFERLAGGAVYITPEWMEKTKRARAKYLQQLINGEIGTYREEDEVILCRICKESGLPINPDKTYPPIYRGLHLGDFKDTMKHRWTNEEKMNEKLATQHARAFIKMHNEDKQWQKIEEIVRQDEAMDRILDNALTVCEKR